MNTLNNLEFGLSEKVYGELQSVFSSIPSIEKVLVFGSRAKGTFYPGSDIDFALISREATSSGQARLLIEDLELLYSVDVVDYRSLKNTELKNHIDRVGKVFYSKDIS